MGPGLTDDKTMLREGTKYFIVVLLLSISNSVSPVTGFALRSCHISYNIAICRPIENDPKLKAVPRDIPRTVSGFDLSANSISKIEVWDFKNLSLLTQLNLKGNLISHIDPGAFHDLISLKKLNLNKNRLANLGEDLFDGLRNLTELRLNKNRMKVVASTFKSLTSLTFLDISNNRLHKVAKVHAIIQHLPNLRTLYMWKNDFTTFRSWELTNSSLKQLTALDVSQNPFHVFEMTADVFPKLTWFNIGCFMKKPMKYDVHNQTFLSRVSDLEISGLHMTLKDMTTLLESVNSSLTSLKMNSMSHTRLSALINISCSIPTMSKLQLQRNKLKFIGSDLFRFCINVTELDLADNKINYTQDNAFSSIQGLRILTLRRNQLKSVPAAMRKLSTLVELDLSNNTISQLGCQDFASLTKLRQLNLYLNPISSLRDCVFKDLVQLQVLKMQSTGLSTLNGAFKKYLPNLRQLRLNENKLTTIKRGDFDGLQSLQNLSLHNNTIRQLERGSFIKLTNLTDIQLQSNNLDENSLNSLNDLINLRTLDFRDNHIHYKNDSALRHPPFSNLARLETLYLPGQHRRLKALLPRNFLEGLTNLVEFSGRNMQLLSFHKDTFNYTPGLQTLDISSNDLMDFSPELFSPIRNLKSLYISSLTLRSLDFLIDANLTELEFLQARKNAYSVISEEVLNSLPALVYLDIKGNSFTCDCDNAWFLQWVKENNQTQVYDAYRFECNYPSSLKGTKLLELDVRSCSVAVEFICYVSTTCMILLLMVTSFTYHFLRLQLTYAYYLFLALLFDTKNKNKKAPYQYDAFISYNTHDEPWVIRELLPKLEGEQGWRLCLHHRDFEPGRSIIDNITDAIYGSRKTICVISRKYLESEWCSKEIQVASFRLFDEQKDVLILVFLEDVPASQLSPYHRMRKLLKRRTYLSWPRAEEHPELFWEKLRQALETGEDHREDRFLLTVHDRQ